MESCSFSTSAWWMRLDLKALSSELAALLMSELVSLTGVWTTGGDEQWALMWTEATTGMVLGLVGPAGAGPPSAAVAGPPPPTTAVAQWTVDLMEIFRDDLLFWCMSTSREHSIGLTSFNPVLERK